MHIPDGLIPLATAPGVATLALGTAGAAVGTAIGLRSVEYEQVPRVAMLSAAFFVISLINIPTGVGYEHLALIGLLGLTLGWAAFPAVLIALTLQLMFSVGGVVTLGINTLNMALPAVVCHYLFRAAVRSSDPRRVAAAGFLAGFTAMLLGVLFYRAALVAAGIEFAFMANLTSLLHLPLCLIEGTITASMVLYLRRVRPELLDAPMLPLPAGNPADA